MDKKYAEYKQQQQPIITPEMIEEVLRTVPDTKGDVRSDKKSFTQWIFSHNEKKITQQYKDFAAALNDQLYKKKE